MIRRFSVNFSLISIGIDLIVIALAVMLASEMRPLLSFLPYTTDIRKPLQLPFLLFIVFPIIWVGIFILISVYDGRKNLYVVDEFTSITLGSLLAAVSLAGLLYLTYRDVSRLLFLFFILTAFICMLAWRSVIRLAYHLNKGYAMQKRKVMIVGAGPVGRELEARINQNTFMGLRIIGFLDDDDHKMQSEVDVVGRLESARDVVLQEGIDDVIIALPQRAHIKVNRLVSTLHDLPVKVWVIPDYFHLALHKANIEDFAGLPMLDLRAPALTDYQRMVKKVFDITLTIFLLPVSLVIMGIITIAIKTEGPGPILFKQKRVGENGRLFDMYKFRTMVPDAENLRHLVEKINENGEFVHKSDHDPRVTIVGRFLRKTSLDELPQLINIIRGDMSLVGPRPELPYLVDMYEPWQRTRFAVPQGITGWWQVNGRSDKPMHLHTEDDIYYVQNYSLLLDLRILLKTMLVVLRGRGAF
jgi:exopolysaccharide biosynthesis polyprenyl glycosylphosphotransferase